MEAHIGFVIFANNDWHQSWDSWYSLSKSQVSHCFFWNSPWKSVKTFQKSNRIPKRKFGLLLHWHRALVSWTRAQEQVPSWMRLSAPGWSAGNRSPERTQESLKEAVQKKRGHYWKASGVWGHWATGPRSYTLEQGLETRLAAIKNYVCHSQMVWPGRRFNLFGSQCVNGKISFSLSFNLSLSVSVSPSCCDNTSTMVPGQIALLPSSVSVLHPVTWSTALRLTLLAK
jgi:hypothetical protein